jgi:hypothetical protein
VSTALNFLKVGAGAGAGAETNSFGFTTLFECYKKIRKQEY